MSGIHISADLEENNKGNFPFILTASASEHTFRSIALTDKVEGFKHIADEDCVILHNEDAESLSVSEGDEIEISSGHFNLNLPAHLSGYQQKGTVHFTKKFSYEIVSLARWFFSKVLIVIYFNVSIEKFPDSVSL